MSLLIRSVNGEPVIEGVAERVERFSTALLDARGHGEWLEVNDGRIVIADGRRTVIYRITEWPSSKAIDDYTFVTAELVSDTAADTP
jgi:hypothetical protein